MPIERKAISVLVTGANGGLGIETCKHLVRDGATRLVMACRSAEKAEAARDVLFAEVPGAQTDVRIAGGFDMTSPESIEHAVADLDIDRPFDVVFLQAGGVVYGKEWQTVEHAGRCIERTVFQNVFGAHATLAALIGRGLVTTGTRVVIAGGEGARGIPGLIQSPRFDAVEELRDYLLVADPSRTYVDMEAMGVSKFAAALWALEAAERYGKSIEVVWFTPGLTAGTNGLQGAGAFKQWAFEKIGFPLMVAFGKAQTAQQGGRKFADCLQGTIGDNGDLIGAPEGTALGALQDQKPMNPGFTNVELRRELWRVIEDACGPAPAFDEPVAQTGSLAAAATNRRPRHNARAFDLG